MRKIVLWNLLFGEILASFCVMYILRKEKVSLNIKLIVAGFLLSVITGTLYVMQIDIAYITTGISGGALMLEGVKNKLAKEDNLKTSGDWRKNLYKLEQNKDYSIKDLYELNSYINPYSNENVVSIIVNQVIVDILSGYSVSEKIRVEEINEKFDKKDNLQRERNKINSKEYRRETIGYYMVVLILLLILFIWAVGHYHSIFVVIIALILVAMMLVLILLIPFIISYFLVKRKISKEISKINKEIEAFKDDNTIKKYDDNKKIYLRMRMIRFLKTGRNEALEIEEKYRSSLTAFDFEVDDSVIEKELTSEENNLVRLSCHVMLKAEWKEWNH